MAGAATELLELVHTLVAEALELELQRAACLGYMAVDHTVVAAVVVAFAADSLVAADNLAAAADMQAEAQELEHPLVAEAACRASLAPEQRQAFAVLLAEQLRQSVVRLPVLHHAVFRALRQRHLYSSESWIRAI